MIEAITAHGELRSSFNRELAEFPDGTCPRCREPVLPRVKQALRFLFRAEPAIVLARFEPEKALPRDFWELIPDGALDGSKDPKWIMGMTNSTEREFGADTARDVFRELQRVAPVASRDAAELFIASLELD
ncbi:hypothetical protein H9P43_009349 [Blastocladiella emersonii ATCC 22665]|nr:hypothetical protein H9P43_009349 [Blastocladiella emersonii ATCC 22665]